MIDYESLDQEEKVPATNLALWIKESFNPSYVLDIGCGPGTYVNSLNEVGVPAIGIDSDKRVEGKPNLIHQDLFESRLVSPFVLCLEVAEHIETDLSEKVVDCVSFSVASPGGVLLWSAAQPGQGGVGHINCQYKKFWSSKFERRGLQRMWKAQESLAAYLRKTVHMGWLANNFMLFHKPTYLLD